jgi:hypothetical protein
MSANSIAAIYLMKNNPKFCRGVIARNFCSHPKSYKQIPTGITQCFSSDHDPL